MFKRFFYFLGVFAITLNLLLGIAFANAQGPLSGTTTGKLAVTPAGYDDIGAVLQKLSFKADEIQESDLANLEKIKQYDAIYINCSGSIDSVASSAANTIKEYVKSGGIVYASDFANSLIAAAFPEKINFYKGNSEASSSRVGAAGQIQAEVVDVGLLAVLGKKNITINYDLGSWVVIDSAGSGTSVLMQGPVSVIDYSTLDSTSLQELGNIDFNNPQSVEEFNKKMGENAKTTENKPLLVSFNEGDGEVLYTTFHNEAQTTEDVKSVLNWFAIRARAGKLTQKTRALISQDKEALQEIVDSINKGETKAYIFNATGKADFEAILNFGGSALSFTIKDPKGKKLVSKKVDSPPYTQEVKAISGKYTLEITGTDVPEDNYPFVLTMAGKKEAMAEPVVEKPTTSKNTIFSLLRPFLWAFGIGLALVILIILGVVIIFVKRKK